MALYALVDGELSSVKPGLTRARCHDERCRWLMYAQHGHGKNQPHWSHFPDSPCAKYPQDGEKGEWHREVQSLFKMRGAADEVHMRSADDQRDHRADVVLPDGRIVEAQTKFLSTDEYASREATYGDMCWLYNAQDYAAWFQAEDGDPARFIWGKPDRRFLTHRKPVFFDCHEQGIWKLERLTLQYRKGHRGRPIYEGLRRKVADELIEFVDLVMSGKRFGDPPQMPSIDPKKSNRGTRLRELPTAEKWAEENPTCFYEPKVDPVVDVVSPREWAAGLAERSQHAEAEARQRLAALGLPTSPDTSWMDRPAPVETEPPTERTTPLPIAEETDWSALAGLTCRCPQGCTNERWGDGGTCSAGCGPCRIMAGTTYTKPNRKRLSA